MSGFILYFLGALAFGPKHAAPAAGPGGAPARRFDFAAYGRGFVDLMRTPGLFVLTISSSFRSMTQGTLLTFLPLYLTNELHYKVQWVGFAMASLQVAGFIASPIAGHLSDRVGQRQVLMSTMAMTAVVLIGVIFAAHSPYFVFGIAVLGFFLYAARPVLQAWLLDVTPKGMGGTTIGMLFGMQALGQAAGPIIGGVVADRFGLLAAFYVLAATIVIANLFVLAAPAPAVGKASAAP
jgi:predicted MFS family arabinose efflux permease